MRLAFAQALGMSAMFAYIAGSPFVLQNVYGLSELGFALCFATNGIGIIIASQLTGRLSERIPELKLLGYGVVLALTGALILTLAVVLHLHIAFVLLGLFGVVSSVGMVGTSTFSLAMQEQGSNAGSASALLGLLPFVGGGLASPLVGIMGEANAMPMAFVILACTALAALNYMTLRRA